MEEPIFGFHDPNDIARKSEIRFSLGLELWAGFDESLTRALSKNALRITLRQLPDDLAKIAHSWGVIFGFTFLFLSALMFAKPIALREWVSTSVA